MKHLEILKKYNLFYEAQKLYLEMTGEFIEISNFDITNLERFYSYEPTKDFLGISFSDDDAILEITIPSDEFEKRLLYIFKELLENSGFSRIFNNDNQKEEYVAQLKEVPIFNLNIENSKNSKKGHSFTNRKKLEEEKTKITT